jgi:hypothetical protein
VSPETLAELAHLNLDLGDDTEAPSPSLWYRFWTALRACQADSTWMAAPDRTQPACAVDQVGAPWDLAAAVETALVAARVSSHELTRLAGERSWR